MGRERQQYNTARNVGHQLHPVFHVFGETRLPARYLTTFSQGITEDDYFLDTWPAFDRLGAIDWNGRCTSVNGGPLLDHGVGFNFDCYHGYLYTGDLEIAREPYPRLLRFFRLSSKHPTR